MIIYDTLLQSHFKEVKGFLESFLKDNSTNDGVIDEFHITFMGMHVVYVSFRDHLIRASSVWLLNFAK